MKFGKSWLLAVSAIALAWTSEGRAASVINNGYNVSNSVTGSLTNSSQFRFNPIDFVADESIGYIADTFAGDFGASARARIGAVLDIQFAASLTNSVSTAVNSRGTVRGLSGLDASGRSIAFVNNNSAFSNLKSTFGEGDVRANLDTQIFAGARLDGRLCFVGCAGGNILNFSIGNPDPIRVLGYDSTTNSVTFLGNAQTGVLPQHFDRGSASPISAELNALDLSGSTGTGIAVGYHSEQRLAGAFIDLAAVLADSFDIPQSALRGSFLGFDYTTVSAKVGVALNAVYDATVRPAAQAFTKYVFSAPMEMFDRATQTFVGIGTEETLVNNGNHVLRPVDPNLQSVSVLPITEQVININANLSLKVALEDHIRLLEIHGNGLDAGPLYKHDGQFVLGNVGSFASATSVLSRTALQPFLLDFAGTSGPIPPDDPAGPAGEEGVGNFVFIPSSIGVENSLQSGGIYLATNFGTGRCNTNTYVGCIFDPTFEPVGVERLAEFDDDGNPSFTYSTSFEAYQAVAGRREGTYGRQWSTEELVGSLAGLPSVGSSYQLPAQIAFNTNPWSPASTAAVPEPASWAMMILGFGLIGGAMRSKRRTVVRQLQSA
jgi:PEP-CTERM motif